MESNEKHDSYWVYDVGYEGVLLRGLDGYGTVGTGFGAGTVGTVQVRYGYGTWVRSVRYGYGTWVGSVRYMGTKTVPTYRTHVPNVPYPLLSVPKVPCTQIAAEIAADLPLFLPLFGYGSLLVRSKVGTVHGYGTWVRFSTVYRTDRTHVPYPCTVPTVPMYRTRTVPVPYPHPYPHQNPYQPSRTRLNPLARLLRTPRHKPNRKHGFHCSPN